MAQDPEWSKTEIDRNLIQDFIYYVPGINRMHQMRCTCEWIEASDSPDVLAVKAVRHARKTGHVLNPRGN